MLMPRKLKHRKHQRGRIRDIATRGYFLAFGKYGLKALEKAWITSRQIEAARRAITRYLKKKGQIWIRIFPDKPMTKTSPETPMGKGKGSLDHFVAVVEPGRILYEIDGVPKETAKEALRLASHKLPIKTKFIYKEE